MTDLTNDQIAEKLQAWATRMELVSTTASLEMRALADELQPKPEFNVGDWVSWCGTVTPYQALFKVSDVEDGTLFCGTGRTFPTKGATLLDFNPLEIARLYRERKPLPGYISTDGLPDGEYSFVPNAEGVRLTAAGTHDWARNAEGTMLEAIVRRKKTAKQPSPTGES